MKRPLLTILILTFLLSCGQKSSENDSSTQTSVDTLSVNSADTSINADNENSTQTDSKSKILELPIIGSFELSTMKVDSLKEYGAGDCWGTVRRYSLPNVGLAIDSMTCGEYGFTYTYYLLSTKDFIQVVYTKKSESILDPKTNSFFYVQQEQVIDFNTDPATSMIKIDTIYDYKLREKPIQKIYSTEILKHKQTTYRQVEIDYKETWKQELVDYE